MMSMLCNCCVPELLILARTWFAFGLPSKTGCDNDRGETAPAPPAGGVACPAKELMRQDGRFAGRLLRVCESFEERNTGASSLRCGKGLPYRFRRGCEPVGDWTAASAHLLLQLLTVRFWPYRLLCLSPRLADL
jgi:hypothetical protein